VAAGGGKLAAQAVVAVNMRARMLHAPARGSSWCL
jgi:hypothetical protein